MSGDGTEHLQAEIARLTAERDAATAALVAERERAERLVEALRPFAEAADLAEASVAMHGATDNLTVGWGIKAKHLFAARAALDPQTEETMREIAAQIAKGAR